MALTGPQFRSSTEDAPRGWVVKTTSTVYRQAMIARYTVAAGGDEGFCDNVGASSNMSILGIAEQNGGALPAGHTLTMSPAVKALEVILPLVFQGPALTTAKRGALVYGVDENTGNVTAGSGIPVGELIEVIDATHGKVGIGPSFEARPIAAQAALDSASVSAASPFVCDEISLAAAVSTTALKGATLITTDPQTISSLVAGGVAALLAHPRNITVTGGGTTAHCPTQVVWTGTDIDGNALTETLALSSGSGTGVKAFKTLAAAVFTGATTGDGSSALGIGNKFGFSQTIKLRSNGLPHVLDEMLDAAFLDPSTATIASAVTSPPHGTWAPADPADGADYIAITYEHT